MKDVITGLTASRKQLVQRMPNPATILPGSLLSRMVRCNKPGCQHCEKGKGKGHGPIWILSVSVGNRRGRPNPPPPGVEKKGEAKLRAVSPAQKILKKKGAGEMGVF